MMFKRIVCAIFGHRYAVARVLNAHTRKVCCTRCHRNWAMHDPTRSLVDWDSELEELYAPDGLLGSRAV
jgi:predicted  nucleic acid-binding Zn ribbon protein